MSTLLSRYGLVRAEALKKKTQLFNHLAKFQLRILDDFGLAPLADETKRDLLEIINDRFDKSAALVTSQLPLAKWHDYLADPTPRSLRMQSNESAEPTKSTYSDGRCVRRSGTR